VSQQVRLGVIGAGVIGKMHIRNVQEGKCPEIVVTAVADTNAEQMEGISEIAVFNSAAALLESGLADAALITTPHYDHPALAIECFKFGLNVMVEKPVGVYTKQVREMNNAADEAGVVFGVMYNQRTDHVYRKLKEIVSSGKLGNIRRVNWIVTDWYRSQAYYDSGTWRATWSGEGGGVLINQCPHNLDLLQWICGMPVMVDAKVHFGKWHDIEVEDDVTAYMEFENKATGTFITSTGDMPGSNRFEITFDGGKLVAERGKITMWELKMFEQDFSRVNKALFGSPDVTESIVETDGKSEQHAGVLNAFAGAILRGEPLIADGREGINGLMLSNAMHLSAWKGKALNLPIDEDEFYKELTKRY
jgi:predicted dehydrogenase